MIFFRLLGHAVKLLLRARMRTLFMMLGPMAGVAALTAVLSLVAGVNKKVMKRLDAFGRDGINLIAGDSKPPADLDVTTLTLADVEAVKAEVPGIMQASPALRLSDRDLEYRGRYTNTGIFGVTENWDWAWRWPVKSGRFIEAEEVKGLSRVCVLGTTVARELFGTEAPLGKSIQVNRVRFRVVGVLASRGASPCGRDVDNRLYIPLTTAMRRVANVQHISVVRLRVADPSRVGQVAARIRSLMRKRHRIVPPNNEDFGMVTPIKIAAMAGRAGKTMKTLLFLVALIALLGGGIVVMNIMLLSLSERRAEIGLRRAVGATRGQILLQFLLESALATFLGGALGILIGLALVLGLGKIDQVPLTMTWVPVLLSFASATLVGIVFGVYPAYRAARLKPVEALRPGE